MTERSRQRGQQQLQTLRSKRIQTRLLALSRIMNDIMNVDDPARLITAASAQLRQVLAVDAIAVWFYSSTSHRYLLSHFNNGSHEDFSADDREALSALQVRSGEALAGRVVSEGHAITARNADEYRGMFGALGRRREALFNRWRALLPISFQVTGFTLGGNGRPSGVIEFFSSKPSLNATSAGWLQPTLDQLGSLLQLVRQQADARGQRRRLAALDAVVTAISTSSDLPDLLNVALLVVIEVVSANGGAICLASPGGRSITLAAQHQLPPREALLLASSQANSVLEDVVYYGQPTLRPVISTSDLGEDIMGRAAMPLLAGGTIVGVLVLYGNYQTLSNNIDWPSLVSMGSQIGIAIANTRLYEESQRERQRLGTVIESIADGVAICNGIGELILANETAAGLVEISILPTLATSSESGARYLDGSFVEADMLPFARALAGEVFRDYRLIVPGSQDQDVVLSFSGAPLRRSVLIDSGDTSFDGAVIVFRDITEQRRLEEAKDEFLAVAAHELRSPLAAIKGYSDLLLRRELKQATEGRDLRGFITLSQQVNIMVQLVDNLLDVSRIDAERFTIQLDAVDLGILLDSVVMHARHTANHHTLHFEQLNSSVVYGDSLKLRQVATNFLTNAIRYSPQQTQIWVQVFSDEHFGYVQVDDQGPGIPQGQRERLFERYYRVPGIRRTGSSTEGLGLGLYLCREIITLHNGRIWVDSAPSGGARFCIAIPRFIPEKHETNTTQTTLDLDAFLFSPQPGRRNDEQ